MPLERIGEDVDAEENVVVGQTARQASGSRRR